MNDYRESDLEPYTRFGTDRFFKDGDKWFFLTREGTMEGPFELRREAENRLEDYIKVMASGLISPDCKLSLQPVALPHAM